MLLLLLVFVPTRQPFHIAWNPGTGLNVIFNSDKKCKVVLELILTAISVFCCCNGVVIIFVYLFIFLQFYVTAVTQAN